MILESIGAIFLALAAAALVLYFGFPGLILGGAKKVLRWQAGLSRHTIQVHIISPFKKKNS